MFSGNSRGSTWGRGSGDGNLSQAAECKDLVPVALKISEELLDPTIQQEAWIIDLLKQAVLIDRLVHEEAERFRYTGEVAETFRTAVANYNLLSAELRMSFGGVQLFNYTIKQHGLSHIALDCTELSPRLIWKASLSVPCLFLTISSSKRTDPCGTVTCQVRLSEQIAQ